VFSPLFINARCRGREGQIFSAKWDETSADSTLETNADETINPKSQSSNFKSSPIARRNLAALILIIFFSVAVGGSLYALREKPGQSAEAKNMNAALENKQETRGTKNIEAYQFYLHGRELWQTRSNAKMEEGIGFFSMRHRAGPEFCGALSGHCRLAFDDAE